MHERSLAENLVRAAGLAAIDEGGSVHAVHVHVGSLSRVDPDVLHDQVEWWSQGTIVEGADIQIEVIPAEPGDRHGAEVTLVSVDLGT